VGAHIVVDANDVEPPFQKQTYRFGTNKAAGSGDYHDRHG
jgi:hypothetical protein